jgi:Tfp pilus assembly protein PilX
MIVLDKKKPSTSEQGFALIIALLTLLLISAALMGMLMMSNTETNVSANFRDEQTAFFASKAGVEEVRDRMRPNATNSLSLSTILANALPGGVNGVLYVTNPAAGEAVTPWLTTGSNYPDDEICKEVTCTSGVPTGTWYATPQSASTSYAASPILTWKWVRVMAKANKSTTATGTTLVTSVDGTTNGERVCWTGTNEIATTAASCALASPNRYQPVYELTALAVTASGSRRMRQYEATQNSFPPIPGAIVFDGTNPDFSNNPHSNPSLVSGTDVAQGPNGGVGCGAAVNEPALGAYDTGSLSTLTATGYLNRPGNYPSGSTPSPAVSNVNSQLGPFSTVDGLTKIVNMITAAAGPNVFPNASYSTPPSMGTNAAPVINVVQGPLSLGGSGAGILLVEGDLTLNGGFSYNGIILVIGTGTVTKNGGGGGTLNGSLLVANMYTTASHTTLIPMGYNNPPGPPTLGWNGGGNATFQYDSCWINSVTQSFPYMVVAQRELIY